MGLPKRITLPSGSVIKPSPEYAAELDADRFPPRLKGTHFPVPPMRARIAGEVRRRLQAGRAVASARRLEPHEPTGP